MKFLIFAFVIAFILEDYGTFQRNPNINVSRLTAAHQIELFRKYALDLVSAAIQPIRNNRKVMEGGPECIAGINIYENVSPTDAIMATMALAKDYHKDLLAMQENPQWMPASSQFTGGLMLYTRLILHVLQIPLESVDKFADDVPWKKYFLRNKQETSTVASVISNDYRQVNSLLKCNRTMNSVILNKRFFKKLFLVGLKYAIELMENDDNDNESPLRVKLRALLPAIRAYRLKSAGVVPRDELEDFVFLLSNDQLTLQNAGPPSDPDTE